MLARISIALPNLRNACPRVASVVLHGHGLYTRGRPKEQILHFGKKLEAQARKLDLNPSSAVESTLERADGPEC